MILFYSSYEDSQLNNHFMGESGGKLCAFHGIFQSADKY